MSALNAHRAILAVGGRQANSAERLSTGMRINRAADDAAGLAISEKMRNQIRSLDQAARNSQDGISLVQTAEGAMEEIHRIMERVRVLTNQAANDVNTEDDRRQILQEVSQILQEVDQIAQNTEFNEQQVLNGTGNTLANELSLELIETMVSIVSANIINTGEIGTLTSFLEALGLEETSFWRFDVVGDLSSFFGTSMDAAMDWIDYARNFANNIVGLLAEHIGNAFGDAFRPTSNIRSDTTFLNLVENSLITLLSGLFDAIVFDADGISSWGPGAAAAAMDHITGLFDTFISHLVGDANRWLRDLNHDTHFIVRHHDSLDLQVQSGANRMQRMNVNIAAMSLRGLSMHAFIDRFTAASRMDIVRGGLEFSELLRKVDHAVSVVSTQRATLGAVQNRLEHTINNLGVASENMSAANSRIRDTDMAAEMMRFTQANVLQQAGMSMLAQANMAPNNVLQLLQ